MATEEWLQAEFVTAEGHVLSHRQMGYAVWKEGAEIVPVPDGYRIDGQLYTALENDRED